MAVLGVLHGESFGWTSAVGTLSRFQCAKPFDPCFPFRSWVFRVINCKSAKMICCRSLPQARVAVIDLKTWFDAVHGEIFSVRVLGFSF